jgi:hypothetical protein
VFRDPGVNELEPGRRLYPPASHTPKRAADLVGRRDRGETAAHEGLTPEGAVLSRRQKGLA